MIARNTTGTVIQISDLGMIVNPYAEFDLSTIPTYEIILSNELPSRISTGILVLNKDGEDLSIADALRALYGGNIEPRDWTGKMFLHPTERPFGTKVHFTGAGDALEAVSDIGSGELMEIHHNVGDDLIQFTYTDFNTITNVTHVQEGQLQWWNAKMDRITVEFVPRIVTLSAGENTPYLYDPSQPIVLPSELVGGAGNVSINEDITQANVGLVQALHNEKGIKPTAFWNADYDSGTGTFENITAAPLGDGDYNIFHVEYAIARFANRVGMVGSSNLPFHTNDTDPIPHGSRLKCTWETIGEDHEWIAIATFKMHRTKSC